MRFFLFLICLLSQALFTQPLFAQQASSRGRTSAQTPSQRAAPTPAVQPVVKPMPASPALEEGGATQPAMITKLTVLVGLSLLPFAIMLLTSFTKIVVVLSLLRNALGVQNSPPNQVLNGIALLVSIYVMFPTGLKMYTAAQEVVKTQAPQTLMSDEAAAYVVEIIDASKEPLRDFLSKNTATAHVKSFYALGYRTFPEPFKTELKPNNFIVLIPAFITSQLKSAFEIGVLIYLPFFVIDLVVSNILLAMGMMMLSPLTIALPIKLLLIVIIDGWTMIIQGLAMTFK